MTKPASAVDALTELFEGAYAKTVQRADADGRFDARDSARAMLDGIDAGEPTLPYEVATVLGVSLMRGAARTDGRPVVTCADVRWLAGQIIEANLCATDGQNIGEPFAETLAAAMLDDLDADAVAIIQAAQA